MRDSYTLMQRMTAEFARTFVLGVALSYGLSVVATAYASSYARLLGKSEKAVPLTATTEA